MDEDVAKRPRIDTRAKPSTKYTTASQIKTALETDNPDTLTQALTSIRNQLALKSHEVSVPPHDGRLTIVKEWMELSSGAEVLFEIWNKAHPRQPSTLTLVLTNLSAILALLSAHYTNHALGRPIMKTLLTPVRLRYMNSYIGGSHNELIIATLKLYHTMSNFAGGQDKKSVLEGFGWEIKSLPNLLNMRRRVHGAQDRSDPLLRPDIRTLFILVLLSFLDTNAASQTKTMLLERHRDTFLAVFKGIAQDHYSLARKVLEACWAGIWSDNKLSRTLKVGLFNETTIGHLAKLYERVQSDNDSEEHIPADLAHHFLLAICTRPGTGICFKDRGWYPRETESDVGARDDEDPKKWMGRLHNKILANVLKTLKVNEDTRQQELAMRILAACPELVAGYWSAALTLEPRLSTKWINNIAFFGNIISLPPPTPSFYLSNQLFNPTPPPLSTVLENILPIANNKVNLSKGLQSSSGLVQHCTAIALTKCLLKFQEVSEQFRKIAKTLEEDDEGQWSRRCKEIEREVRQRVPDFMVVVAFGHQTQQAQNAQTIETRNPMRIALLGEGAQRLLWLYHRCLPAVVAEARFDVGKLLQSINATSSTDKIENERDPDAVERVYRVHLLHTLRLLKDSDQFAWANKIATLPHTPFFILLRTYTSSTTPAIRTALGNLICHILSQSVLFQEDPHEPDLWLKALPAYRPIFSPDLPIQGLDTIDLQDESTGVIAFLDECVQRCLRTLYRYVEAQRSLVSQSSGLDHLDEYPSPLIMTLFEQLEAKTNNKSLCPVHVIGVTAFLGKLIFYLASKTKNLYFLKTYAEKIDAVLSSNRISEEGRVVIAVEREVRILRENLAFTARGQTDPMEGCVETGLWITRLEKQNILGTKFSQNALALRIIDKLRTLQEPLSTGQLKRLVVLIDSLDISTLPNLIENLVPGQADLWSSIQVDTLHRPYLAFERLYIHTARHDLVDTDKQAILVETIFTPKTSLLGLKRVVFFIMHGIQASKENQALVKAHVLILAQIFGRSKVILSEGDVENLKDLVFVHPNYLKDMFLLPLPADILDAVDRFLMGCINHLSTSDRKLLSDISAHWFNLIKLDSGQAGHNTVTTACIWVKYLEPSQLLDLLYFLLEPDSGQKETPTRLLQVILKTLSAYASSPEWQNELPFTRHLPRLISLRSVFPNSLLDQVIASAVECSIPMGLNGLPVPSSTGNLAALISRAKVRWAENLRLVKTKMDVDILQFLNRGQFSDSTSRIVQGLLYRQPSMFSAVMQWIKSEKCSKTDIQGILPVMHGSIDIFGLQGQGGVLGIGDAIPMSFLPQIAGFVANESAPTRLRLLSQQCLHDFILASGTRNSEVLDVLAEEIRTTMKGAPTPELIDLAVWLGGLLGSAADKFLSPIVDGGMQWSIAQITDGNKEPDFESFLRSLGPLVKVASLANAQLVETLVSVIIQHCSSSGPALQLATTCVARCQLKPVVINRLLQSVIQHPHFGKHASIQSMDDGPRDALIKLLHVLFNLHPNNTCQITHIEPLIKIYRGTLSISDLRILSIFQLFESQRKLSVTPLLSLWSASSDTTSTSALEALQSLDPATVFKTCLNFPRWRRVEYQTSANPHVQDSKLYDPVFLLLLFSHMIGEHTPSSNFAWVDLLRTNVASLFLRALSAKDEQIRELALCQVVALWRKLENADFQEKLHVQHLLNMVRYLIPAPSSSPETVPRLPTYATLLLSHALRAIFYPTTFLYPLTARFLLQRPTLDISDVPMLYGMLYSSSDDNWKKDRAWMIKFLADGMVGSDDWRVLKRRHTWDLLASLFQSGEQTGTTSLRSGVLEVLANLTCNAQATTSLILKSGLLTWIEMQLINSTSMQNANLNMESVLWIKILDNILVVVKPDKIESATNGEWRMVVSRCLCHLLDEKHVTAVENLTHTVPVILRLVSLNGTRSLDLTRLLELAIKSLEKLEAQIQLPANFPEALEKLPIKYDFPLPPHRSATLQQCPAVGSQEAGQKLSLWGNLVEMLWHSSMLMNGINMVDVLVPRILLWRSLKGGLNDKTDISEWTRREVVRNLYRSVEEHVAL